MTRCLILAVAMAATARALPRFINESMLCVRGRCDESDDYERRAARVCTHHSAPTMVPATLAGRRGSICATSASTKLLGRRATSYQNEK